MKLIAWRLTRKTVARVTILLGLTLVLRIYDRQFQHSFASHLLLNLRIVAAAEAGLARCSGEDFGVRACLAIPAQEGMPLDAAGAEAIRRGVEKRKQWWRDRQQDYPAPSGPPSTRAQAAPLEALRPAAPDFTLRDPIVA